MRDLPELLDTAAGRAGDPVDLADVERRARRQRTRRAAVAVAACSAVALVAAGSVVRGGGDRASLDVTEPAATGTPAPAPTVTPEPTPAPTPTPTPAATTPPRATVARTTPPPATEAGFSRDARGAHGLRVTVRADAVTVPAGRELVLRVRATDDDGAPVAGIGWGDGVREPGTHFGLFCEGVGDEPVPSPGRYARDHRHAWRTPGDYVVRVTVVSDFPCDEDSGRPVEQVTVDVPVEVRGSDPTGNGPAEPDGSVTLETGDEGQPGDPVHVVGTVYVADADGYARRVVIDWGDGSAPTVVTNKASCDDGDGRRYPRRPLDTRVEHTYAEPGSYAVTMSYETTACDGSDPQRGGYTTTWGESES